MNDLERVEEKLREEEKEEFRKKITPWFTLCAEIEARRRVQGPAIIIENEDPYPGMWNGIRYRDDLPAIFIEDLDDKY